LQVLLLPADPTDPPVTPMMTQVPARVARV
jgi:hypothetical protein